MIQLSKSNKEKTVPKCFIKLVASQTINMFGDAFSGLALTWFIVQTGSPMQVGINLALSFLPNIILAPFIGSVVDKVSRKFLMWISDIVRLFLDLILICFVIRGHFSISIIYVYSLFKAIVRIFYMPAQTSLVQQLSDQGNRVKVNAFLDISSRVAMIAGPILAGFSVRYFSMEIVLGIDAITFLLSAIIIYTIKVDEREVEQAAKSSYFTHVKEGLTYVRKYAWIIFLSLAFAFVNGGNALANVSRPFLVSEVLQLDSDAYGVMNSFASAGAIIASIFLVKSKPKHKNLSWIFISILIWGLGISLLSLAESFFMVVLIQVIAFSMGPVMSINANVFYQNEVPPSYMGRVYAIRNLISSLAMPVGFLFGDLVIRSFGISSSFIVSGAIIIVGAGFVLIAAKLHSKSALEG